MARSQKEFLNRQRKASLLVAGTQLFVITGFFLAPVLWLFWVSLTDTSGSLTLGNYMRAAERLNVLQYLLNSVVVAVGSLTIALPLGTVAAATAAERKLYWIAFLTLLSRMAPGMMYLFPLFAVYVNVGLYGSHLGLIIAHVILVLPLIVWIVLPHFESIPTEIKESAILDGCSASQLFIKILLPLASTGISAAGIIGFITSWNYFLFAVALSSPSSKPLTVAIFNFIGEGVFDFGAIMAAAVVISIPPLLVGFFLQRWLIRGLYSGALK